MLTPRNLNWRSIYPMKANSEIEKLTIDQTEAENCQLMEACVGKKRIYSRKNFDEEESLSILQRGTDRDASCFVDASGDYVPTRDCPLTSGNLALGAPVLLIFIGKPIG